LQKSRNKFSGFFFKDSLPGCNICRYIAVPLKNRYLYFVTVAEYNHCVDHHSDGVYRFILHHCRDKEEAKDIVQDAFEKLWLNHASVNAEKAKSYLFTTNFQNWLSGDYAICRLRADLTF
jgi:hypothetical protein